MNYFLSTVMVDSILENEVRLNHAWHFLKKVDLAVWLAGNSWDMLAYGNAPKSRNVRHFANRQVRGGTNSSNTTVQGEQ